MPVLKFLSRLIGSSICGAILLLFMAAIAAADEPSSVSAPTFDNPILSGFYPDPSICRVGDDYYLVNSSFEYFPGVPIFHSTDLVHWQQIGYCLTRNSQLPLKGVRASGGIYAPTLRYHDGTFYLVTTNVDGGGNFYVTATNPAGPWSEPIWLDHSGIDPSLFFDDDGTVYYTRHEGMGDGYIAQRTLNLKTGKLEGELKEIWRGTGGVWPEGPHIYKYDGRYYLMAAEGGTSYGHQVTVARSDTPWGPFEACPNNPILTHSTQPQSPIQATGHADLVETPHSWWLVCLGIRPQGGQFHHLGRETFLAPVAWNKDGWPVVNGGRGIELKMPAPPITPHTWSADPIMDDFDATRLAFAWNFLRNPHEEDWSLTERPGFLRLHGSAITLNDRASPAFIGRRQTALACTASTRLSFNPANENEEAGLTILANDKNHCELGVTLHEGVRAVFLRKTQNGKEGEPTKYAALPAGDVTLIVAAQPLTYDFNYQPSDGSSISFGTAATRDFSSEKAGGFTGVYFGMFATGNGQACTVPADFDWFQYHVENR